MKNSSQLSAAMILASNCWGKYMAPNYSAIKHIWPPNTVYTVCGLESQSQAGSCSVTLSLSLSCSQIDVCLNQALYEDILRFPL